MRRQVYKDANHKPEMAIALTDFEALCGFVGHEELVRALDATPELAACVGPDPVAALHAGRRRRQGAARGAAAGVHGAHAVRRGQGAPVMSVSLAWLAWRSALLEGCLGTYYGPGVCKARRLNQIPC